MRVRACVRVVWGEAENTDLLLYHSVCEIMARVSFSLGHSLSPRGRTTLAPLSVNFVGLTNFGVWV